MGDFSIEIQPDNPNTSARDILYQLLGEDNSRRTGRAEREGFAVLLRNTATQALLGGLWAVDDCGWAFIDLLYVPERLQGQGLGARMIAEAETIASSRGMIGLWVNTYDFQAPGFYEKLGYSVFGRLEGDAEAAGQVFLRKRLRYP